MANQGYYNHLGAEDLTPAELRNIRIPVECLNFILVKAATTSVIYTMQHHKSNDGPNLSYVIINSSYDSLFWIPPVQKEAMRKNLQLLVKRVDGSITREDEFYRGKCITADVMLKKQLTTDLVARLVETAYTSPFEVQEIGAYFAEVPVMDFNIPPKKLKLGSIYGTSCSGQA